MSYVYVYNRTENIIMKTEMCNITVNKTFGTSFWKYSDSFICINIHAASIHIYVHINVYIYDHLFILHTTMYINVLYII